MADQITPLFGEPPRVPKQLSQFYSHPSWRAAPKRRPTYTNIKAAKQPTCDECFANQLETKGASGPRSEARARRAFPREPVTMLNLCRHHESLWRERDTEDSPPTR